MSNQVIEAVQTVRDYKCQLDEFAVWYGYSKQERSYSKWACDELITRLLESTREAPLEIVNKFIDDMGAFSNLRPKNAIIFETARMVGEDVVDRLICW